MFSWHEQPHTLLGSALGLLLVFRTNAAYQRFQEGRKLWEELLNVSRDIARMAYLYQNGAARSSNALPRRVRLVLVPLCPWSGSGFSVWQPRGIRVGFPSTPCRSRRRKAPNS